MWPHCGQCPHQPQDDASAAFAVRPRACRQTASRGGNGDRDGARRPPAGTACRRYLDRAAARERLDERGEAGHLLTHPAGQDGRRVCPERGDIVDEEALPASIGPGLGEGICGERVRLGCVFGGATTACVPSVVSDGERGSITQSGHGEGIDAAGPAVRCRGARLESTPPPVRTRRNRAGRKRLRTPWRVNRPGNPGAVHFISLSNNRSPLLSRAK